MFYGIIIFNICYVLLYSYSETPIIYLLSLLNLSSNICHFIILFISLNFNLIFKITCFGYSFFLFLLLYFSFLRIFSFYLPIVLWELFPHFWGFWISFFLMSWIVFFSCLLPNFEIESYGFDFFLWAHHSRILSLSARRRAWFLFSFSL